MSSIPHSPPETPLKPLPQMAVDGVTPARKRAPDGPVKAHSEGETKIPATPSRGLKKPTKVEQPTQSQIPPSAQPPRQGSQPHETQSQGEDEAGADGYESQPESIPQDPNADLPDFDYEHLNADFNAAMAIAGRNETELVDKFHRYAELLCTWSQAASDRDEQRAFKRLKTREKHVKLAEGQLEAKEEHHAKVVDAFQQALKLLRQ